MINRFFLLLIVASIFFAGCASKRYGKKAKKFDEAGLYVDAAKMYYESVLANGNNIESKLGLQRNGQLVLMEKLELFKTHFNNNADKEAVYAFLDADQYARQVNAVGIKLIFPADNQVYYSEVKERYLEGRYQVAMMSLDQEQFAGAEQVFKEIIDIDAAYKDAKQHWVTAKYEPIYRNGLQFMESQLYRKAFYCFSEVMEGASAYKEVVAKKAEALDLATITIAVAPFVVQNHSINALSQALQSKSIHAINQLKTPFFKVVIDEQVNALKGDWRNSLQAVVTHYIAQNKNQIHAKTVLTCRILRNTESSGELKKTTKPAYAKRDEEYTDAEGRKQKRVVYDKVVYEDLTQRNEAILSAEFSLVDVATGNVVAADVVTISLDSQVHYATYQGDVKSLVPGYWKARDKVSPEDSVRDYTSDVAALQSLLKSNRNIVSASALMSEAVAKVAAQLAATVEKYNPEV